MIKFVPGSPDYVHYLRQFPGSPDHVRYLRQLYSEAKIAGMTNEAHVLQEELRNHVCGTCQSPHDQDHHDHNFIMKQS